ncbi:MAG: MBL fold metallo-hydrolase [Cyanobacteria bacterium J06642_2]
MSIPECDAIAVPSMTLTAIPELPQIFASRPNREAAGGTAYLVTRSHEASPENVLIDCPAYSDDMRDLLHELGGVRWLFLTHRTAIGVPASKTGTVAAIARDFNCEIIIQEQEAYLLPHLQLTTFHRSLQLAPDLRAIWTPGHSPGSSCFYLEKHGGVLFTGRHLLPDANGFPVPQRQTTTFHWPRQRRSVEILLDDIAAPAPAWICPGAKLRALRGMKAIAHPRPHLERWLVESLVTVEE